MRLLRFCSYVLHSLCNACISTAGRIAGEQAARADVNGGLWFAVGCLGGLIGVIIAYAFELNPPATHLLGKSPEYVAAYTDAYRATAKSTQANRAVTGCVVGCVVSTLLYAMLIAAAGTN